MLHLTIRFAKYKIILYIFSTSFENFIEIKQVWPQLQSQRHLEVKLKIYAISLIWSHERQNWKKGIVFVSEIIQITSWIFEKCRCQTGKCLWTRITFQNPVILMTKFRNTGIRSGESITTLCVNFQFDLQWSWRL